MVWYQFGLAVHALVAVLGIGQVLAIAFLAADLRPGSEQLAGTVAVIRRLSRVTSISLGLMLLSGIGLMIPTHGAYGQQWWFRISFLLFLVLGFFNGQVGRGLRKVTGPAGDAAAAIGRLRTNAWTMCGLVAIIVCLMAAKPF
jgi:hypothetical protein